MTSGRVRALTRSPRRLEIIAKNALPVIIKEMELHLEVAQLFLSVPHHKLDSQYTPTHLYEEAWEIGGVRQTGSGLTGTIKNEVRDRRGRAYAVFVAGTESEESPQAGDWVGPWNQLTDALRGLPGQPTFRQKITKAIHKLLSEA